MSKIANNLRIKVYYEDEPKYDIVIGRTFDSFATEFAQLNLVSRRICVVTDSNVGPLYAKTLLDVLKPLTRKAIVFEFPAGEQSKCLKTVQDLYGMLIAEKFERKDILIALGGGVVGDLAGFAAATYLRGIDFIQIPTSLLAQVDSSIGGKTGIDFRHYKNMIGAFYQPKLVYMNISSLKTLPERELLSGMGEVIKHGFIKDSGYVKWIRGHINQIKMLNMDILEEMIYRSCNIKRGIVESDPKESGERALLNFGHTIGHAIESQMDFSLLHGECVGLGMICALYISMKKQLISEVNFRDALQLIKQFNLLYNINNLKTNQIVMTTLSDKKMDSGIIQFVLLNRIGNAVIDRTVTEDLMVESIEYLKREFQD